MTRSRPGRLRWLLLSGWAIVAGCASGPAEGLPPRAYYATGFPLGDVSGDLERILPAVLRTQVRGFYDVYVFDEASAPTEEEVLRGGGVLSRALRVETSTTAQAATAVLVGVSRARGTLLTTDHGVVLPDTTFAYLSSEGGSPGPRRAERVAVLRRQLTTVIGSTFAEPFVILARSPERDLALLGFDVAEGAGPGVLTPLRVPMGEAARLSWGSFVYVLGYPAGRQMVTRAIVSRPTSGSDEAFLTDGLVNEGGSGAPILAVRGDGDALEWVGIARAAATRREARLVAGVEPADSAGSDTPYAGPIYLRQVEEIRYGISFSVPSDHIRSFFAENRSRLAELGYAMP